MIYNVLVSLYSKCDSVIHIHISTLFFFSHTCTCIHSPPNPPPVQPATLCRVPCFIQYILLVIYLKYSRVYLSIPNSLTIPLPLVPPHNDTKTFLTSREKYMFHSPSQLNQSSFSPIHVQSIKTIIKIRRSEMVLFHY